VYNGEPLLVPSPSACEDDPDAIGPHSRNEFIDGPPVWRDNTIETKQGLFQSKSETLRTNLRPCFLWCESYSSNLQEEPGNQLTFGMQPGRWRTEARVALEDLPNDEPEMLEFTENRPPD